VTSRQTPILAIDPGTDKCGIAVVGPAGQPLWLQVVSRSDLPAALHKAIESFGVQTVLVGSATGGRQLLSEVRTLLPDITVLSAPERNTTLRAREVYFREHPPRGWRRLIPRGLLLPPRPIDDYAAFLIAIDWLVSTGAHLS
jgi:RNase H-fold protein (predicted Holliday junction resolvase)